MGNRKGLWSGSQESAHGKKPACVRQCPTERRLYEFPGQALVASESWKITINNVAMIRLEIKDCA
jgi:Fe-S-cluster-containing dehydrogenase component